MLVPHFKLDYFEFDKQKDKSVEFCSDSIIIDGFFFPTCTNRFSLGYQISINRDDETIRNLENFGKGVIFSRSSNDDFFIKSLTKIPVFIKLNTSNHELKLEPGSFKKLFNLNLCAKEAFLPPKKKIINFKDFEIKLSIGKGFTVKSNGSMYSSCWIVMNLIKFMDINLAKKSFT